MKKCIESIGTLKNSFMRLSSVAAGTLALITLTNLPTAFAAAVDEPYQLKNQAFQTSTLFTAATISRNVNRGACHPKVYKGNVYGIYAAPGTDATRTTKGTQRMMVYKVPLDGSAATTAPLVTGTDTTALGYYAAFDNHRTYTLGVDRAGHIHVSGDMHSMPIVYWRSTSPGDISSFIRIPAQDDQPPGKPLPYPIQKSVTFPNFLTGAHGQLMFDSVQGGACVALCSYDETTRLWTSLGGVTPPSDRKGEEGLITFAYEENRSFSKEGSGGERMKWFKLAVDRNNRTHYAISILNKSIVAIRHPSPCSTDIIYAYSDDGGKTVHRSNGTQIKFPIRAEAGPNQGDIVLREDQDPKCRFLNGGATSIGVDKEGRPMIRAVSYVTGDHFFRLEDGAWVDYPKFVASGMSTDPSGVVVGTSPNGFTRFWNPASLNTGLIDAPDRDSYDESYYRETGELVWSSLVGRSTNATLKIYRTVLKPVSK